MKDLKKTKHLCRLETEIGRLDPVLNTCTYMYIQCTQPINNAIIINHNQQAHTVSDNKTHAKELTNIWPPTVEM